MVVSLTVGLSIVSKSITNVRTSTEEANSAQALAAAEAGAQKAIQSGNTNPGSFINGSNFSVRSDPADISAQTLTHDEGADLWLVNHNTDGSVNYSGTPGRWDGNLTIYWGDAPDGCSDAALEMIVITTSNTTGSPTGVTSSKYTADACPTRRSSNQFSSNSGGAGSGKAFSHTISITNGVVARIVPIYGNANVAVTGTSTIPSQGSNITSTGKSANDTVQRKLSVFRPFSSLPVEFFSYGLFSPL